MGMFISNELAEALCWQVIGQINMLTDGLDDQGFPTNCCPICCGPCSALNKILDNSYRLSMLNNMLASHPYIKDGGGWDYWKPKGQTLRVKRIKKMWFKLDGTRKAICASSDSKDESDDWHKVVLADIASMREGNHV